MFVLILSITKKLSSFLLSHRHSRNSDGRSSSLHSTLSSNAFISNPSSSSSSNSLSFRLPPCLGEAGGAIKVPYAESFDSW